MHIDAMTMARARLALREASRGFLFDPNVSLIDFGNPEHEGEIAEDQLAIRFHVRQKLSGLALENAVDSGLTREIPETFFGFQTDVPQGIYRLHGWWWRPAPPKNRRATRFSPLKGGLSISDENHHTYGTLGGLVRDRTSGEDMILSNWHVLVGDWNARRGQRIYQPGRLDGGRFPDTVATLTRDAMNVNLDAAVASLLPGGRHLINEQLDLGSVTGVGFPTLGMRVVKSGRRTGITYGRVTAIEGITRIRYASIERLIGKVVTIEPEWTNTEASAPGDSGSWWLDASTREAVALHFAGSNFPERALGLDMPAVLDALNIDLVVGLGRTRPQSFAAGFNRMPAQAVPQGSAKQPAFEELPMMAAQEIPVGIPQQENQSEMQPGWERVR